MDNRPYKDYDELISQGHDRRQNDYDISLALDKKDLDMALYNVLDQVAILESFLVGIIEYFEWTYQ